jgi:hypothetical protein
MSERNHESRPLRAFAVAAAVLVGIGIVVASDPLAELVGAVPWPDLAAGDLPDLPGWAKWIWRGIVLALIALAVEGARALHKTAREHRDPQEDERL